MSIITLLTDFGSADGYLAEVKGTLLSLAPGTQLVDITHDVPPGDIADAAYAIGRSWRRFPEGTIHLCVVDPGVGTARRGIAVGAGGQFFVGPDNGLFSDVYSARPPITVVSLQTVPGAGPTFHGRDVFAPAAAAIATGKPIATLGAAIQDPVKLPAPKLQRRGSDLVGEVIHVDRFGTLITNIPAGRLATDAAVRLGVYDLPLRTTFADVPPGDPVAFIGSGGTLEIAVRNGRADVVLGSARGAEVKATAQRKSGPKARETMYG
jgi:S-adenosylmethionine hydrolase